MIERAWGGAERVVEYVAATGYEVRGAGYGVRGMGYDSASRPRKTPSSSGIGRDGRVSRMVSQNRGQVTCRTHI